MANSRNAAFQHAYTHLNKEQKDAVDTIEGPVMVVAGPGTGKTQILTLRIANILLKTQINPSNILALTFTQAAALNMRERLLTIMGPEAHSVNIFTFHAFCADIIERNPDDFWNLLGKKVADEVQKVEIVETIISDNQFEHIKPFGKTYFYVSELLRSISDLKREGVTPQELQEFINTEEKKFNDTPDKESSRMAGKLKGVFQLELKRIQKNRELQEVYDHFTRGLAANNLYDYDDLIMSVLEKLKLDEDFRLRQMEQYQYLLVDEHQDSNNAQNKMLNLLTSFHKSPNIFIVGDEKQAIFRFQGASVENFRKFTTQYPGAKLITLTENYRSTQTILDSAVELLGIESQKLQTKTSHINKPIHILTATTPAYELSALAQSVKRDFEQGVNAHEIAVLTRTRAQMKEVASALNDASIPAHLDVDEDIFESKTIAQLITLLKAVYHYAEDEYVFSMLHLDFLQLYPLDLYKLTQMISRRRKNMCEVLSHEQTLITEGIKDAKRLYELFTKLGEWYLFAQNESVHSLIHKVASESGLLEHSLKSANPILAIAPIRELYDHIQILDQQNTWKLKDFFTYLQKIKEHNIRIRVKVRTQPEGKVQIMTVHSAKGLEFDHVYIPFAQDSVWGGKQSRKLFNLPSQVYDVENSEGEDNEERRLFFVALTRARKHICISYSDTTIDGSQALQSRFIEDIRQELKQVVHLEHSDNDIALPITHKETTLEDFRVFVQSSFAQYGLSVSALNNYLSCPWKYFYTNLVRVPSGKDKVLMFGNAVHNALSIFFKHYKETGEKSCDYLLQAFEIAAQKELFTKAEINDAIVRGKQILMDYYHQYEGSFSRNLQVKVRIAEVYIPRENSYDNGKMKLTGELDLVMYLDASLTKVEVVDFKTGKPKTRNEIIGKTKHADGNYYRQLVFYKLLLKYFRSHWHMVQGVLDFVQADTKGIYHREAFDITDEEVTQLELQVIEVMEDIVTLGFWNRFCDEPDCEWCMLRKSLDERIVEGGLF